MTDHDDNIFDEDDALDFIIHKEMEEDSADKQGKGGCLGILFLLLVPVPLIGCILSTLL